MKSGMICGQCAHMNEGEGDFTCTLMSSYHPERSVTKDLTCKLLSFGQADINALIKRKEDNSETSKNVITAHHQIISKLQTLERSELLKELKPEKYLVEGRFSYGKSEPIWTDKAKNRNYGDTNFQICGWCEHASGSHRYSACVSGRCKLLPKEKNNVEWDTPCLFVSKTDEDIYEKITELYQEISHEQYSSDLSIAQKFALSTMVAMGIPATPNNRNYAHFNIGDEIMVFIPKDQTDHPRWVSGFVINGYRHQDGCVSAILDEKIHEGFLSGRGYSSGFAIPNIMLKTEYDFFAQKSDLFTTWVERACIAKFNGKQLDGSDFIFPTPKKDMERNLEMKKNLLKLDNFDLEAAMAKLAVVDGPNEIKSF